jgi:hypothetical protein
VWGPLKRAEGERNRMQRMYTEKLGALLQTWLAGREQEMGTLVRYDELGITVNKSYLISMALNLGNEGNLRRLLEGSEYLTSDGRTWNEAVVMDVLGRALSRKDWEFVQKTWDLIDTLWPEIAEQEKRRTGIVPPRVDAREVVTPYGTFRGGYYPVVYDHRFSDFAKANMERDLFESAENGFRRPHTWAGFTEARKEVSGPLMLDLYVLPSHIDKVIHHLTHWEAINNVNELLRRKEVRSAVKSTLGDAYSYENYWLPWLQGIANDRGVHDPTMRNLNAFLSGVRNNVTVFTLGFRATTLAVQVLGQLNAMGLLRKRLPNWKTYYFQYGRVVFQPHLLGQLYTEIAEKSDFIRDRVEFVDRDTRDAIRDLSLKNRLDQNAARFSMQLIGLTQLYTVDLPIWNTAYHGLLDQGVTEAEAVDFADSIVSMSQSAGGAKDLAPIQRGDAVLKQFLMFYGFLSAQWNQLRRAGADVKSVKDVPSFLATFAFALLGPSILAELARAAINRRVPPIDDDDDGEWSALEILGWMSRVALLDTLAGLTGLSPAQQIASSALGTRPREVTTPTGRVAETIGDAIRSTSKASSGDGEIGIALLDWVRVVGLLKGLPFDQVTRWAKEAFDED